MKYTEIVHVIFRGNFNFIFITICLQFNMQIVLQISYATDLAHTFVDS